MPRHAFDGQARGREGGSATQNNLYCTLRDEKGRLRPVPANFVGESGSWESHATCGRFPQANVRYVASGFTTGTGFVFSRYFGQAERLGA